MVKSHVIILYSAWNAHMFVDRHLCFLKSVISKFGNKSRVKNDLGNTFIFNPYFENRLCNGLSNAKFMSYLIDDSVKMYINSHEWRTKVNVNVLKWTNLTLKK